MKVAEAEKADVIAFSANSVTQLVDVHYDFTKMMSLDAPAIEDEYALVMGYGAAKSVRDAFRGEFVQHALGRKINKTNKFGVQPDYYIEGTYKMLDSRKVFVIAVQVKRHFKDNGDFELTRKSLQCLARYLRAKPDRKAVMNCPLIGAGGFADRKDQVVAMVEEELEGCNIIVCVL